MKIKSFETKSGQKVILENITIFVGPNNVGKSQTLKDIKNLLEKGISAPLIVLDRADFEWPRDFDTFLESLNMSDSQRTIGNKTINELKSDMLSTEDRDFPVNIYRPAYEDIDRRNKEIMGYFTKFFVADLSSSNRLLLASSVNSVNPETSHPANLLQALFLDGYRDKEAELKKAFKDAFNMDIMLDYSMMTKLSLRAATEIGDIPEDPRKAYSTTRQLTKIEDQGDGFRSFAGIILALLFSKGRIILLDEPEAFLHPAQARFLGRWIGDHKNQIDGQLIISSHSANFLSGIIASGNDVDIYRLNRTKNNTSFNMISATATKSLFENSLLSSQRVIESVFYRGVVICEADADRAVYQSVATINHNSSEDVLFIHSQNLQTLHIVAKLLKDANIPVAMIADIDALSQEGDLCNMVKSVSDSYDTLSKIMEARRLIAKSVNGKTDDERLDDLLDEVKRLESELVEKLHSIDGAKSALNRVYASIKPWREVKENGIEGFDSTIRAEVSGLLVKLKELGIFIVPVGELEGWIKMESEVRKKRWIVQALAQIHKGDAPENLVSFVKEVLNYFNLVA